MNLYSLINWYDQAKVQNLPFRDVPKPSKRTLIRSAGPSIQQGSSSRTS